MMFRIFNYSKRNDYERNAISVRKSNRSPQQDERKVEKELAHESRAVAVARTYIDLCNKHDNMQIQNLFAPNCTVEFEEAELLATAMIEEGERLVRSFPDLKFRYDYIEEVLPGVAKIINIRCSGTHTGDPYSFRPFPEIPAKGTVVLNDPEDAMITIDDATGLIKKVKVICRGRLTGPPGFYEQIGGILF